MLEYLHHNICSHPKALTMEDCVLFAVMKNYVVCTDPMHLGLCRQVGPTPKKQNTPQKFWFLQITASHSQNAPLWHFCCIVNNALSQSTTSSVKRKLLVLLLVAGTGLFLHHGHRKNQITTVFVLTVSLCKEKIEV